MKSTGEVMGVGIPLQRRSLNLSLGRCAAPQSGQVFVSVKNPDKPRVLDVARTSSAWGFTLVATRGTATALAAAGLPVTAVNKVAEGRPHIVDMLLNDEIALVINTVKRSAAPSGQLRHPPCCIERSVPTYTTIAGARAAATECKACASWSYSLQALHQRLH